MNFMTFHILGRIIPTDFHIFPRGRYTTNQIICIITYNYGKSQFLMGRSTISMAIFNRKHIQYPCQPAIFLVHQPCFCLRSWVPLALMKGVAPMDPRTRLVISFGRKKSGFWWPEDDSGAARKCQVHREMFLVSTMIRWLRPIMKSKIIRYLSHDHVVVFEEKTIGWELQGV